MNIDAVLQRAKELRKIDKHAEAVELLNEALRETADARLFHSRGITFEQLDQPDKAVDDIASAILLGKTNPRYFFDRACILADPLKRHDEAIEDFEQAIQLQPDHVDAHRQCSGSLLIMGKPNRALEHAETALKLAPNEAGTHFFLGEAYISLNRYKEAVASLKRAVELDPSKNYYFSALSHAIEYLGICR
jgi:tetratricopeptide (TPR) repeat protein